MCKVNQLFSWMSKFHLFVHRMATFSILIFQWSFALDLTYLELAEIREDVPPLPAKTTMQAGWEAPFIEKKVVLWWGSIGGLSVVIPNWWYHTSMFLCSHLYSFVSCCVDALFCIVQLYLLSFCFQCFPVYFGLHPILQVVFMCCRWCLCAACLTTDSHRKVYCPVPYQLLGKLLIKCQRVTLTLISSIPPGRRIHVCLQPESNSVFGLLK